MQVKINGELKTLQNARTVAELLRELDLQGKRVAVERNGEIVPKSLHASTPLNAEDQLEIVVAVGGG
ncbi:sulfur carrier protein ThiS [Parvibium lacunae]|uniref:Sulfur carrier protein ThiS n=1 Tax=Parvibium lacunae TaxID=1888893 RepID=A0A368L1G1_9BURK|nr:sulfur carrier protein ThiS [Parvibium lacunae]RCS57372.1 sulfur carrier protein ThiS [Parvibium lacunae]